MLEISQGSTLGFASITVATACYEVTIIPEIGGRIIGFGKGGVNLLYQKESLAGYRAQYDAVSAEEMRKQRIEGQRLLYGGEKTWLAPQSDWGSNPYADLDHGAYKCKLTEQGPQQLEIVLTSPVCRETGLQLVRTLTCIDGEPYMDIEQQLVNCGDTAVTKGLWQVTMLNRPGTAYIPEGEALAEPPIVMFRPENAAAEQISGGTQMVLHEAKEFKMGFVSDAGWASASYEAANGNTYILTKRFRVETDRDYPHGMVVEVYNAGTYPYYELEVHSPAYTLQPGESASFTVRWELQAATKTV